MTDILNTIYEGARAHVIKSAVKTNPASISLDRFSGLNT